MNWTVAITNVGIGSEERFIQIERGRRNGNVSPEFNQKERSVRIVFEQIFQPVVPRKLIEDLIDGDRLERMNRFHLNVIGVQTKQIVLINVVVLRRWIDQGDVRRAHTSFDLSEGIQFVETEVFIANHSEWQQRRIVDHHSLRTCRAR